MYSKSRGRFSQRENRRLLSASLPRQGGDHARSACETLSSYTFFFERLLKVVFSELFFMNKIIGIIIVIAIVGLGAWYFMKGNYAEKKDKMQATSTPEEAVMGEENTIIYTDAGFSPSPLTIQAGETVEFKNTSSREMYVASAMHPTHTGYPGTDIEKCGTAGASQMFDTCEKTMPGASWTFTFNEKGEWPYHDHINAKYFGKIVVE